MIEVVIYTDQQEILEQHGLGAEIRKHFQDKGYEVGTVSLRDDPLVGTKNGYLESGKAWDYDS